MLNRKQLPIYTPHVAFEKPRIAQIFLGPHKLGSLSLLMGRQGGGGDSTMVNSSIALLQERFRQLERVREKREEKEMLKLFNESDQVVSPAMRYEPNKLSSFQPEMILPHHSHRPHLQESLSLGLNYQDRHADFRAKTTPTSTGLWPNNPSSGPSTSRSFDHSDVDTSLHL